MAGPGWCRRGAGAAGLPLAARSAALRAVAVEGAAPASPLSGCGMPRLPPPCQASPGLWEAASRPAARGAAGAGGKHVCQRQGRAGLLQRGGQGEEHRGESAEGADAALEKLVLGKNASGRTSSAAASCLLKGDKANPALHCTGLLCLISTDYHLLDADTICGQNCTVHTRPAQF